MDHAAIGEALRAWASALTGVPEGCVRWEGEPAVQHNGQLVVLRWVSEVGAGVDATHYDYVPNVDPLVEMVPTTTGNRVAVLQVDVEAHDQRPGESAHAIASRARTRARWPRLLAMLDAVELAVASVGQAVTTDYTADEHVVSRRSVEVRLHGVARETDPAGATAYIASVAADADIETPAGTELPETIQPGGTLP